MRKTDEPKSKPNNSLTSQKRTRRRNRKSLAENKLPEDIEEIKQDLSQRISRCSTIIHGLKNHEPFKMMVEDFSIMADRIDDNWHLIPDGDMDKLREARITKLAAISIINALGNYKFDYDQAQKKLTELENPKTIQSSYYDEQ